MKIAAIFLLAAAIFAAKTTPRIPRGNLAELETRIDRTVVTIDPNQPGALLGLTRGVYLEGYGVVFSTEMDLIPYAAPNPFRPEYTKAEVTRLKGTKQLRIAVLRQKMRDSMIAAASSLDSVQLNEQIAYAVTIPYSPWEESAGMPRQIVMQATKAALLQGSRGNMLALDAALKVQDF